MVGLRCAGRQGRRRPDPVPRTRWRPASWRWWALLVVVPALVACLPVPDVQVPLLVQPPDYRVPLAQVAVETVWLETPAAPDTPSELNRVGVRRTHVPDVPTRVVVIAVPGLFGGAAAFDPLARQLVASEPGVELWAIDRRANLLEDREGIQRALEADDPEVARAYYARGGEFEPLDPATVPFMARWGLEVHLRDLQVAVLAARAVADAVVLAGHSLGAGMVSVYPAARIALEQGGGIGEDYVDGLLLLDGSIGRTGAFGWVEQRVGAFGVTLVPTVSDLESGRVSPFLRTRLGFGPDIYLEHVVAAVYAALRPDELAPPDLSRYPVTNRARAGILADDEYAVTPIFSASVGEAVGARFAGNLTAFVLTGADGARSRTVVGVADGAEYVDWSAGDPTREVTDLDDVIAGFLDPESDVREWYFPLRLGVDLASLDPRLERAPGFVPMERIELPALAIGAGRGLITSPAGFQSYVNTRPGAPIAVTVVPGLTHYDIVMARANPVVPIVLRWLRSEGWLPPRPR